MKFVLTWTLVGAIVVIQESRVILDDFINYSLICDQTRPELWPELAAELASVVVAAAVGVLLPPHLPSW